MSDTTCIVEKILKNRGAKIITRRTAKVVAISAMIAVAGVIYVAETLSKSQAQRLDRPMQAATPQLNYIQFKAPALAPMAYTAFCQRYPDDCTVRESDARPGSLSEKELLDEIKAVNLKVNRQIVTQAAAKEPGEEDWRISPSAGDCGDYVVTKRHEMLAGGWPSAALLMSEVVDDGEHHLVLVVRTKEGDMVLDNITDEIRPIVMTHFQWVRVETPNDPKAWSEVRVPGDNVHTGVD
jgi:predicted transglutaminase-like cysteine proteinase